jgi:hypothetical protein
VEDISCYIEETVKKMAGTFYREKGRVCATVKKCNEIHPFNTNKIQKFHDVELVTGFYFW